MLQIRHKVSGASFVSLGVSVLASPRLRFVQLSINNDVSSASVGIIIGPLRFLQLCAACEYNFTLWRARLTRLLRPTHARVARRRISRQVDICSCPRSHPVAFVQHPTPVLFGQNRSPFCSELTFETVCHFMISIGTTAIFYRTRRFHRPPVQPRAERTVGDKARAARHESEQTFTGRSNAPAVHRACALTPRAVRHPAARFADPLAECSWPFPCPRHRRAIAQC